MADAWRHTPEELRQYVTVVDDTGGLIWRERPTGGKKHTAAWNTKYAGKPVAEQVTKKGYKQFVIGGRCYLSHRVIWALTHGEWPEGQIDHINGDRADNRPSNLRDVSAVENARNRERKKNRAGKVGVVYYRKTNKWRAQIGVEGQHLSLGYFDTFEAAVAARVDAERFYGFHKNHGRYGPVTPVKNSRLA